MTAAEYATKSVENCIITIGIVTQQYRINSTNTSTGKVNSQ